MQSTILFVHQSSELYGSDKTLLILVVKMKEKGFRPIVVLPQEGLLSVEMEKHGIEYIITPVIKITRTMFTLSNLLSLPMQIINSRRAIEKATKEIKIDLVYSNTLAVLIGLIYAKKKGIKHIWHVHEIIQHPKIVRKIFSRLLKLKINDQIIFNSKATQKFWMEDARKINSTVVWNGIDTPKDELIDPEEPIITRSTFNISPETIVIALVGRINRLKGQQLLLKAFQELDNSSVQLVFVGSPPPFQDSYLFDLETKITKYNLNDRVQIIPFQKNIWNIWKMIDIAVVPSTEPESFGLVAVEAMLCSKPVIASDHGGLSEIIVHNETGLLFEPSNILQLKIALKELISDENKRKSMGEKGKERAILHFTQERYAEEISNICLNIIRK